MRHLLRVISLIVCIIFFNQISSIGIYLADIYFVILFFILILLILLQTEIKINALFLALFLVAFLTILLNDIPAFFKSYKRYVAFIMIMLLISPSINSSILHIFRANLFKNINNLLILMTTGSILLLSLGIHMYNEGRSDFRGLFSHSMILGPMAGIAVLNTIYLAVKSNSSRIRFFIYIITIINFIACIASGSRSAIIATLIGTLFFLFALNLHFRTRLFRILILFIISLYLSFPLWEKYTVNLKDKLLYSQNEGSFTASRTKIWDDRIQEFLSSPIIGIGFTAVDTNVSSNYEVDGGKIEPGSSWLAVLSMTGLAGFILVIWIFYRYIARLIKSKDDSLKVAYYGGILILFLVHMFVEGYIFSAGSGMFFYLWLLIGVIHIEQSPIPVNI
jgi:O-antigen ligase